MKLWTLSPLTNRNTESRDYLTLIVLSCSASDLVSLRSRFWTSVKYAESAIQDTLRSYESEDVIQVLLGNGLHIKVTDELTL